MSNGNESAFPRPRTPEKGLTKREHFAGLAMQGLMTRTHTGNDGWADTAARTSCEAADALLSALSESK